MRRSIILLVSITLSACATSSPLPLPHCGEPELLRAEVLDSVRREISVHGDGAPIVGDPLIEMADDGCGYLVRLQTAPAKVNSWLVYLVSRNGLVSEVENAWGY